MSSGATRERISTKVQMPLPVEVGDDHVAQQAVRGHGRDVGPQHASDDDRSHRHGRQHANHRPLGHDFVQRQQQQVDPEAHEALEEQQPQMERREVHLPGFHAAESDEEHQKNEGRGNHLMRGLFECRYRTAQQGSDDHRRRHGDRLYVTVQIFQYVHVTTFLSRP